MIDASRAGVRSPDVWSQRAAFLAMWLMTLIIFSAPNRESVETLSALDPIAIIKVLARIVALAVLGLALLRSWRGGPQHRLVLWTLTPLALYTLFAIASTAWSPLPAVTVGQSGGLLAMVLLTAALALTCRTEEDARIVLLHLTLSLIVVCLIVVVAHIIDPSLSGLTRGPLEDPDGSPGILHPTAAGSTASLVLTVLLASWLLWAWRWTGRLLVPGLILAFVTLDLAVSRMAAGMALLVLGIMFLTLVPRSWFGLILVGTCTVLAVSLAVDPALDGFHAVLATGFQVVSRGDSVETMSTLTGRTELWAKIWESFLVSPIVGHGYFVTSATGDIDVWSGPANRTAHNVVLQALVSTGIVGCALFLWGLWRPIRLFVYAFRASQHVQQVAFFSLLVGIWFLGWGQLSESILGPVRPESVVFFTTLGLAIGSLSDQAIATADESLR